MSDRRKNQLRTPQARIPSPCYGCGERTAVCHAGCGRFAEYRGVLDSVTDRLAKGKDVDLYVLAAVRKSRELHKKASNAERR